MSPSFSAGEGGWLLGHSGPQCGWTQLFIVKPTLPLVQSHLFLVTKQELHRLGIWEGPRRMSKGVVCEAWTCFGQRRHLAQLFPAFPLTWESEEWKRTVGHWWQILAQQRSNAAQQAAAVFSPPLPRLPQFVPPDGGGGWRPYQALGCWSSWELG